MFVKAKLIGIIVLFFIFSFMSAQESGSYYVAAQKLNVRTAPSIDSTIVLQLDKYDNVIRLPDSLNGWSTIIFNGFKGYVSDRYIKKGKCIVDNYTYRVGAVCNDGTRSNATGRGACSHHGGVSYWLTETKQSVRIIEN
jgi:uncharacterized protein YgiM (DUF1202 family)